MEQYAALLRSIAAYAGLPSIKQLSGRADVKDVYRVTVQYSKMRAANSVTTILYTGGELAQVETVYHGYFGNKPIARTVSLDAFRKFALELRKIPFDKLSDQPSSGLQDVDLWLVERASAGFMKSVILCPSSADARYLDLYNLLSQFLPETLREIK